MKTKTLKISEIVIDAGTQQRERINDEIVAEYAESMKCGAQFPAVTVFFDGAQYYLVDGFHRYWASKSAEIPEILAGVHDGTRRDAVLFSAGVNGAHGIRLSNSDKRKAVLLLINDEEWSQWSNRDIAKHCNVSHAYVNKLRDEIAKLESGNVSTFAPKPAPILDDEIKLSTGFTENSQQNEEKELDQSSQEFVEEYEKTEIFEEANLVADLEAAHVEIELLSKEVERLTKIIESDDQLKQIKQLQDLNNHLTAVNNNSTTVLNQFKSDVKFWKGKFERLEKKVKHLDGVEF